MLRANVLLKGSICRCSIQVWTNFIKHQLPIFSRWIVLLALDSPLLRVPNLCTRLAEFVQSLLTLAPAKFRHFFYRIYEFSGLKVPFTNFFVRTFFLTERIALSIRIMGKQCVRSVDHLTCHLPYAFFCLHCYCSDTCIS